MNPRNRSFWAPVLVGIPIAILINLITQYLDVQFSIAVLIVSIPAIGLLLTWDRVANWWSERSRQNRTKAIKRLGQEMREVVELRSDIPKLVARIAWDLLLFQATLIVVVLFYLALMIIFPVILARPDFIAAALIGFIIGLVNQISGLRYIKRVFEFEAYKAETRVRLVRLTREDWAGLLVSRRWVLVHTPPDQIKPITFLSDGRVGEGQNENENLWRINKADELELVQSDGNIHNRFLYDPETKIFNSTNDLHRRSLIEGQYIYLSENEK